MRKGPIWDSKAFSKRSRKGRVPLTRKISLCVFCVNVRLPRWSRHVWGVRPPVLGAPIDELLGVQKNPERFCCLISDFGFLLGENKGSWMPMICFQRRTRAATNESPIAQPNRRVYIRSMNKKLLSEVMRYLGSQKSTAKAKASRVNGRKGGRPKKVKR